jgi:hypothetical protein
LLHSKLIQDLIAWKKLLEASGGKLELTKCFYCILSWKFNELGDAIPTTIEEHCMICPQITIPDTSTNSAITIHQKEINEFHGCDENMIYDNSKQQTVVKTKSDTIGFKIKNADFSQKQGWILLNGSYIPAMKFSLPAMSLSREELDEMQQTTNYRRTENTE